MALQIAGIWVWCLGLGLMVGASAAALAADGDQVILKNGDRITGHVLSTGSDAVSLATDAEGTISIRRAAIERVVTGTPTLEADVTGLTAPVAGAGVLVRPAVPVVAAQPSAHCMAKLKPVPATWAFQFQGAPNKVVLGTESQEVFGAGLDASFCEGSPRDTTSLAAAGNHARIYERGSASIVTDVADAELEQQHFLHSAQGAAIYAVGEAFTNNALGMAMQKSAGVGVLSPQFRYRTVAYDVSADARYLNQHLDGSSPVLNFAALRFKEQVHVQGKLFTWNEQGWIMPGLNDVHALQAYASFGPSLTVKPWLKLGLTATENYLGNAPPPNRKSYFTSALTLTVQGGSGTRSK